MISRTTHAFAVVTGVMALIAGLLAAVSSASAQDVATPAPSDETLPHLAHINVGTCAELSHIVHKLEDIPTAGSAATPSAVASPVAVGEMTSTTQVEVALDELLAEPHAINIHESIEAVDTYVACGDITGTPTDGELEIEMAEQNGSGVSGTATLTDNGDGTTTVVISLTHGEPSPMGTPDATPVG
jgi:hypothetical protein